MIVKNFYQLTGSEQERFFEFFKNYKEHDHPAIANMWHEDWSNQRHTLPYLLYKTDRFQDPNGNFHIVYDGDNIASTGGVYKSQFCDKVALVGVRSFTARQYQHKNIIYDYIHPANKTWAIDNGCKILAISVNEYNRNLFKIFTRTRLGERAGKQQRRQPYHLYYNGLIELDFPVNIQYTKQWVGYERLDPTWDYDWRQIEWKDEDSINRT